MVTGCSVSNMEITHKTKRELRIQGWIFTILFLAVMGLLGWLSTRYHKELDWTATGRHTLSEASLKVLQKLEAPVNITSYASGSDFSKARQLLRELIKRYKKGSDKFSLEFVDPMTNPDKTRELGIRTDGEMIIEYQGRTERVQEFKEEAITNALQRLLRNAERQIVFITGHGERDPEGSANHDMGVFIKNLKSKGFKTNSVELIKTLSLPENIAVLVIASPQFDYLQGEVAVINKYIDEGGHLLWLMEPDSKARLKELASKLKVKVLDGVIVDLDIRQLGVNDPTIVMGQTKPHAITTDFNVLTLYPRVVGLENEKDDNWQVTPFLESIPRSWLETSEIISEVRFAAAEDIAGPIKFGLALTRKLKPRELKSRDLKSDDKKSEDEEQKVINSKTQRVVVMGDGDFISNAYLGNQGNQNMGENIMNWLTHDDNFIDIPPRVAPDAKLVVSKNSMIMLGATYLLIIPLLLGGSGVFIWLRRRKR